MDSSFLVPKNLSEISPGSVTPIAGAANAGGVGYNRRLSTNISLKQCKRTA